MSASTAVFLLETFFKGLKNMALAAWDAIFRSRVEVMYFLRAAAGGFHATL